jgi:hypothetical protein
MKSEFVYIYRTIMSMHTLRSRQNGGHMAVLVARAVRPVHSPGRFPVSMVPDLLHCSVASPGTSSCLLLTPSRIFRDELLIYNIPPLAMSDSTSDATLHHGRPSSPWILCSPLRFRDNCGRIRCPPECVNPEHGLSRLLSRPLGHCACDLVVRTVHKQLR